MIDDTELNRRINGGYTDDEWAVIASIIGDMMPDDVDETRLWMHGTCFAVLMHEEIDAKRDRAAEERNYGDVSLIATDLLAVLKEQPEFWEIALEVETGDKAAMHQLTSGLEQLAEVAAKHASIPRRRGRPPRVARMLAWRTLTEFWRDELGLPVTRSNDPVTGEPTGRLERFLVAALAPACVGDPPTLQAASDFIKRYRAANGQLFA